MTDQAERLSAILRQCPTLMTVLTTARALALPDWMIFSGAVYQPVWNHLTGRPPEHGISDYDLAYFDGADTAYEAEDRVIKRVAAALDPGLRERVEVRNQARVHLWFEARFGEAYAPLSSSAEALRRFSAPAFAVGVRLEADGALTVFAPFGLDDVFAMTVRPNPLRPNRAFDRIAAKARARWPELTLAGEGAARGFSPT